MMRDFQTSARLASSITREASKQTYYIVRLLVDRDRVDQAYQAYAYFRWVDDCLDEREEEEAVRLAFVRRQAALVGCCYQGQPLPPLCAEEEMLEHLIAADGEANSGLQTYIRHMLKVMAFDAARKGNLVSERELTDYTYFLASAVTEALHHFIGHGAPAPVYQARYLAATGAHIAHMLRDTLQDNSAGYFNIPRERLQRSAISPHDLDSMAYREWVRYRVIQAQDCFRIGKAYLAQVHNWRCRLAGYTYIARFEPVLQTIEADGYLLHGDYSESYSLYNKIGTGRSMLRQFANRPAHRAEPRPLLAR